VRRDSHSVQQWGLLHYIGENHPPPEATASYRPAATEKDFSARARTAELGLGGRGSGRSVELNDASLSLNCPKFRGFCSVLDGSGVIKAINAQGTTALLGKEQLKKREVGTAASAFARPAGHSAR
jgi:hypothetical protein